MAALDFHEVTVGKSFHKDGAHENLSLAWYFETITMKYVKAGFYDGSI